MKAIAPFIVLWFTTSLAVGQYTLRNYAVKEGLPQSQAQIMLEDKNGYLWIGTAGGGLARFDGRTFKVYTTLDGLLSNMITNLKLDSHDNLWIVHPRGITKFDGVSFKVFKQPPGFSDTRRVRKVLEHRDTIFFITMPGRIGKIYNDSVYYWAKPIYTTKNISYSHLLPDKSLLFYLNDSSFYIKPIDGPDVIISYKSYFNRISAMFNKRDSLILNTDKGYLHFDYKKREFKSVKLWVKNNIVSYDSSKGEFWTRHANVILKESFENSTVKVDTVLRNIEINQIFFDSEGNTWFATSGEGIYKYFIQDFNRCASDNLRAVMAILKDKHGSTWIGTSGRGLWQIKNGKTRHFFDPINSYRNAVYSLLESKDGSVWAATNYGIGKYSYESENFEWYTREHGLSHIAVINLQQDNRGRIWAGTLGGGLNYMEQGEFKSYTIKNGLRNNLISALYYNAHYDKLYFGDEFGLCSIKDDRIEFVPIKQIENSLINSISSYQDSLILLGTGGSGVAIYDPVLRKAKMVTSKDGLPSDFIYFVVAEKDGRIWIGSEKGITQIRLDADFNVTQNLHFDHDNGLEGVETNQNAYFINDNTKYFGLVDGIYEYTNAEGNTKHCENSIHLTDVQLHYGEYDARSYSDSSSGFYKLPLNPVFTNDKNHLTFLFNRVDKGYPKSVRFKYILENFDKTWSLPVSTNQVTYTNVPPGDYVFKVMATNHTGSWGNDLLVYPFTIKPAFYQTSAFALAVVVFIIGVGVLIHYIQLRRRIDRTLLLERIRTQEQENLRKEIARDFHDEMGNQLTRIINYVSLLRLNGHAKTDKGDLYTKVEQSAKYLYSGTRDFIWAIDPINDELSKLFIHIRDFGEKLFEERSINFRAYSDLKDKVILPYGFSREANLIFKEVMTNSFKHSDAKNVKLTLENLDDQYVLLFEDDGAGFNYAEVASSNGLRNIRERASRIGSTLRLHSAKGSGTRISLHFKKSKTNSYGITI